jgi:hypothetical protein
MSHKDLVFKHGDDYGIWKLRAMEHLATKDLFGVDLEIDDWVKKNPSILKECARDKVIEKYEESQEKGLLILYSLLDTSVIKKLGKVTTVQEAFTKLGEIYEKQGEMEVIVFIHKLINLRMKGNDVEGYLSKFDGVMRDVEKRGHNMVKVERAIFMLCGIPEEWSFLRSQVFLQYGYEKLTTEVVKTSLREYGVSLEFGKKREEEREDGEWGLIASVKCEKCKRRRHTKDNYTTKCYGCGKIGHVAANCLREDKPKKKKKREVSTWLALASLPEYP